MFYPPDEWKKKLPPIALDGELWSNRDDYNNIVSIVKNHDKNNAAWKKIKFMVFDAPLVKGNFEQRIDSIKHYFTKESVIKLV